MIRKDVEHTPVTDIFRNHLSINQGSLSCAYIDASVLPMSQLAQLYHKLSLETTWHPPESFCLVTCQRVEVYSMGPPLDLSGLRDMVHLLDSVAVRQRLSEVAAGVRSHLLGERFILEQVERSARSLPVDHPITPLVVEAIEVAKQARQTHSFIAVADYPELVSRLLPQDGGLTLVVGGGMLAQAVAARLANDMTDLVMVTRSLKKLRRSLAILDLRVNTINYFNLAAVLDGRQYTVVIATDQVTDELQSRLSQLVSTPACKGAVDLCSVPICPPGEQPTGYITMYDPEFAALVAEINEGLRDRVDLVRSDIASYYRRDNKYRGSLTQ